MTRCDNVLRIGGQSSGKMLRAYDSLIDHVRANPTARVCIISRAKLSPFLAALVGYVRMAYPDVTVTVQEGCDGKHRGQVATYQYVTDWPQDSS